jgi:hypothetical protein
MLRKIPLYEYKQQKISLILGFRRDVDVICGLLGNYTAWGGGVGTKTVRKNPVNKKKKNTQ